MTIRISKKSLSIFGVVVFVLAGYALLPHLMNSPLRNHLAVVLAAAPSEGTLQNSYAPSEGVVPQSYGRLVAAIADRIGTGLVFEDKEGVIRFVSITGMKEGQLARYDQTPTHGGIPKSYGRLVTAVVNAKGTGLIFEDADGVIRFVTIAGVMEGELKRE